IRLLLLLLLLPAVGSAQDYTYTTNDGAIAITRYTGPGGIVTVPGTIDGLPVVSLGPNVFDGLASLTSVTIPEGVTNIGFQAFQNCYNLTNVTFPESLTFLGSYAFNNC